MGVAAAVDQAGIVVLSGRDGDDDPLTFALDSNPIHGQLTGTPPTLTYTPNGGFSGNDSFTFHANDGSRDSNVGTVNLSVNLGAPALDEHDTLTTAAQVTITGSSTADTVEVSHPGGSFTVAVTANSFSADVPLAADRVNDIFFTAIQGALRSAPAATSNE